MLFIYLFIIVIVHIVLALQYKFTKLNSVGMQALIRLNTNVEYAIATPVSYRPITKAHRNLRKTI